MSEPFKGTINVDIRDSEPDWSPFEPPRAPDGAPNVVCIVLDDVGFSALCVGRDSGAAVTDDYPDSPPHRFTGGTIRRVAIDVSGEPYLDLEREAAAMLARE